MKRFLIVVDMQNDFVDGALGTREAEAIVGKVARKIRDFDGEVLLTLDTHGKDYLKTQEGSMLPVSHCVKGTGGWTLNREIAKAAAEAEALPFEKITFGSRQLAEYLTARSWEEPIGEIQLVGLCTDICVISNALMLKAFLPEVPITVDASCCAGVNPVSHENALDAMDQCQITITGRNAPEEAAPVENPPFRLHVTYTAKPGKREAFVKAIEVEGLADKIRWEDGCLRYDYFYAAGDDETILLVEAWESEEKQQIHMTQPHMERLMELKDEYIESVTLEKL